MHSKTQQHNIRKFLNFFFLILLFLILFSVSAIANPNQIGWGNYGARFGTADDNFRYTMFGSNYPQGNVDFTKKTISVSNEYTPIIYDMDSDGQNEMYAFSGSSVYQFDEQGNLITELILDSTVKICGTPAIGVNALGVNVLVVMTNVTSTPGTYTFYELTNEDGNIETDDLKSWGGGDNRSLCDLHGGINSLHDSSKLYSILINNEVISYDIDGNLVALTTSNPNGNKARNLKDGGTVLGGGTSSCPTSPAGELIMCWLSHNISSPTTDIMTYRTDTGTFDTAELPSTIGENLSCGCGFVGSDSGTVSLIATTVGSTGGRRIHIYDSALVNQFSLTDNSMPNPNNGYYSIADIDQDGQNEFCAIRDTNQFMCYDAGFSLLYTWTTDKQHFRLYHAIGEFTDLNGTSNTTFSEILTAYGVLRVNDSSALDLVYNFGLGAGDRGQLIPVALKQKSEFIKDILFVDQAKMVYYTASGTPALCGNNICESGETTFNCFADCGGNVTVPTTNQSVGNFGVNQACNEDSDCFGDLECINFVCSGRVAGAECTHDFECYSGECNDQGRCTKASFTTNADNFFKQTGFTSTKDLIFIALVIVMGGVILGASAGSVAGVLGGVIGSVVGLIIALLIDILVFGYIGIWILFTILISALAIGIITIVFKSS